MHFDFVVDGFPHDHSSSSHTMSLLGDAIRSAIGADQVNNGFWGPNVSFSDNKRGSTSQNDRCRANSPCPGLQYSASSRPQSSIVEYGHDEQHYLWNRAIRRPLVLPQITYGDGQHFLRAYSDNVAQYGIYKADSIALIDAANVLPNPENQIFQKSANTAGGLCEPSPMHSECCNEVVSDSQTRCC